MDSAETHSKQAMQKTIDIPWFHYFANVVLRFLFRVLLQVDVKGLANTPPTGPVIAAMNHTSFLDSVLVTSNLRPDVLPIAKTEVFKFPLSLVFYGYGAFPVKRGEPDLGALRHSLAILKEDHVLLIAPEGTRSKSGTLESAREGTALIALKSRAVILPIAIWGTKAFWSNLARLRRTPVGLRIGEPLVVVPPQSKQDRQVMKTITDEVMYYIARLLPPEFRGKYADVESVVPKYVFPRSEIEQQQHNAPDKEVMKLQN